MARWAFLLAATAFLSAGLSDALLTRWDWVAMDAISLAFSVGCAVVCWRDA